MNNITAFYFTVLALLCGCLPGEEQGADEKLSPHVSAEFGLAVTLSGDLLKGPSQKDKTEKQQYFFESTSQITKKPINLICIGYTAAIHQQIVSLFKNSNRIKVKIIGFETIFMGGDPKGVRKFSDVLDDEILSVADEGFYIERRFVALKVSILQSLEP